MAYRRGGVGARGGIGGSGYGGAGGVGGDGSSGYQRVKVIGKGAFGAAILVRKGADLFVRKEVPLQGLSTKEKLEAEHEAAVLKGLSHRNIIHYVDSGVSHAKLWIIMAYASGGDLDVYIQKKKRARMRFTVDEATGIFAQCCLALNYLHSKKILHRDLKSKNIFLDKKLGDSTTPLVKLGDFGIAKVLQNTRDNARTQIGTPYYLSPEICEDKPYSFRSDVWAMGIILFEMLALRVPFEARDLRALVRKIVQAPVPKLPAAFQKPPELQLLVTDLLAKNPQRRPDIAEVLNKAIVKSAVHTINELDTEKAGAALKRTFTKTTSLDVHRKVEKRHPPQQHQQHHQHQHQQQQQHHQQHQQQVQLQRKHGQRRHPQQQQEQQQQRQRDVVDSAKARQQAIAKERARHFREFKAQLRAKQARQQPRQRGGGGAGGNGAAAVAGAGGGGGDIQWLGGQRPRPRRYTPEFPREPVRSGPSQTNSDAHENNNNNNNSNSNNNDEDDHHTVNGTEKNHNFGINREHNYNNNSNHSSSVGRGAVDGGGGGFDEDAPLTRTEQLARAAREQYLERRQAGQANARKVLEQLGRAPIKPRMVQQQGAELQEQQKNDETMRVRGRSEAADRARRLQQLTDDEAHRQHMQHMQHHYPPSPASHRPGYEPPEAGREPLRRHGNSHKEQPQHPHQHYSQHARQRNRVPAQQRQQQQQQQRAVAYDAHAAAREAYLERQRQAMVNARRINADLGRAYNPTPAPDTGRAQVQQHVQGGNVGIRRNGTGPRNTPPSREAESHAERLKRLREERKHKEIQQHEMALEEARRQAFVDRAVAQSRLRSDRGQAVEADVPEDDGAGVDGGDVQYLDLVPLSGLQQEQSELQHQLQQLQEKQQQQQQAQQAQPKQYHRDSVDGGGHGSPGKGGNSGVAEDNSREAREQRKQDELRRREQELAQARKQHFEDLKRLRQKVSTATTNGPPASFQA